MSDDEKAQHESEYKALLALFIALLKNLHTDSKEEALYELCELRAEFAINHALKGMNLSVDEALMLLQNYDDENLTQRDKDIRDRVVAAVNNLIDFAVCEEYQLYLEASQKVGDDDIDFNSDDYEDIEDLCDKYNDIYAAIENSDIEYAMAIAAWWVSIARKEYLVYWTQNDTKVRPWHMALQGYAAPRDEFPAWMIPPIEWNCRCFLTTLEQGVMGGSSDVKKVMGSALKVKKPEQISDVFSESVAKCGRIFSDSHPYFKIKESDKEMLDGFVKRIRQNYYGKEV